MSGLKAPLIANGPENYGGVIVVISYVLMIMSILFGCVRIYNAFVRKKGFGFDDLTFHLAIIAIIPQSVAIQKAVSHGLGQHLSALNANDENMFFKWIYISQLLSLGVQTLAKLSIILLVVRLDFAPATWAWCRALATFVFVWATFAIFTVAFQCGTDQPWLQTPGKCAADGKLYYPIVVLNVISDAFLATFFLPVIWKLQMETSTRTIVSLLFASRLLVCGVSIGQIAILRDYVSREDKSWGLIVPVILDQVVVNLSVITAGVPSVHRFLSDLKTGTFSTHVDDHELSGVRRGSARTPVSKHSGGLRSVLSSNVTTTLRSSPNRSQRSQISASRAPVSLAPALPDRPQSLPEDEKPLRLAPQSGNEISTHIYARGDQSTLGTRDSLEIGDVEGRKSPTYRNGVMQKTEISVDVEYLRSGESSTAQSPTTR